MSSVFVFAVANGGGPTMVWGVRDPPMHLVMHLSGLDLDYSGWPQAYL
jgi:hypothetical protein